MLSDRADHRSDGGGQRDAACRLGRTCPATPLPMTRAAMSWPTRLASLGSPVRVSVAGGSFPQTPNSALRVRARLARAQLDLLVLSLSEAASLLGEASSASAAARALGSLATMVVVTDGSNGSALAHGSLELVEPSSSMGEPGIDSTGAGDALTATLVAELLALPWPPSEEQLRADWHRPAGRRRKWQGCAAPSARVPSEHGDAA